MYLFELVADVLCGPVAYSRATSAVARICLVGSAGWPGLAPRAAGVTGFVGEAIGRAACVCRFDGLGFRSWAAGFVSAGVVWVLLVGEGGGVEGLRRPGEVFDGLVAG